MKAGHVIKEEDLHLLSPGDGYKWNQLLDIVGKTIIKDIPANEIIYPEYIA